jgi:hypothetical protein
MADTSLDRVITWLARRLGPPPGPPRRYFSGNCPQTWIREAGISLPSGRPMAGHRARMRLAGA